MCRIFIVLAFATLWFPQWNHAAEQQSPNIIYLLADDLGDPANLAGTVREAKDT